VFRLSIGYKGSSLRKIKRVNIKIKTMKRVLKLSGLFLVVALTGMGCRHAGSRLEERFGHFRMSRHENAMEYRHMRNMDMRRGMEMRRDRMQGRGPGEMFPGSRDGGLMRFDRIPGLTDAQRKEMTDLRLKHMQDMDKFREETFAKMQDLREKNRKEMMNILTPEQQKSLESSSSRSESAPPSTQN
jgi:hypothetical protein